MDRTHKKKTNKRWTVLDLSKGNWLGGCGLLLVDLMWATGLSRPHAGKYIIREEKRRDVVAARGEDILIQD